MGKEKKIIERDNWVSSFNLIGEARVNEDYTYKIDERNEGSSWIYNSLNLGIDCGEKYGVVYAEMFGGYSANGDNVIYAHGKKDDGSDDFSKQMIIDWEDRNDPDVLEEIGDLSFITVGLEKTDKDKTYYKKFLSPYDAIAYIKENLENGTVVNVKGTLKYSSYNDKTQVRKTITSIVLSRADEPSKYAARFVQSVLLNKESVSLKTIDKETGSICVDAKVLDYVKEVNGVEVKGQFPFDKQFEYIFPDIKNEKQCKSIIDKLFKVKKGVTQITFEGEFIEGGATVTATWDDVPDDIKDLVECGIYTKEEALARCSTNGNRVQRMILRRPQTKHVENGESTITVLQVFPEKYTEDDLYLDYVYENEKKANEAADNVDDSDTESVDADSDMDWLNAL